MDFWLRLFDPTGFVPRRLCGDWSPGLIWLHNASDFLIWTAYLAIPIVLVRFAYRRRHELPFTQLFWLFGLFIVACGSTHLMDIVLFYNPLYRLSGAIKLVTAAASWGTVIALVSVVPHALAMRSPEALQREIEEREKAEDEVRQLNAVLEERVQERTAALEAANHLKEDLLQREQQARQEAEAANRLKDEFLATLSHELRTPLNSTLGWAHLLRSGKLDPATTQTALETIERSTQVQAQLVNDILDVSRIVVGKFHIEAQPVTLSEVITAGEVSVRPTAQSKGVQIDTKVEDASLVVQGDVGRLQQIVWNLLSNAIKFTPAGGRVTLQLTREENEAVIRVRDSGQGIAADFLPFVFDRFRQADSSNTRRHGGLGMGLAVVRHLAELHGGTVHAHSDGEGQGATFTLRLPLSAPSAPLHNDAGND